MDGHVPTLASQKAVDFINSVLRLQPKFAVFDCDGTLWAGDAGEGFLDWELKRGVVSDEVVRWARPRYADYKSGKTGVIMFLFGQTMKVLQGKGDKGKIRKLLEQSLL